MQQERPGAPLPFEACENFRELGGYTGCGGRHVKYGAFYRSPALANIKTPADRARFEELGVRTVFDFRSEKERTLAPDPDFPGVVNIPASAMLAEDGSEVDATYMNRTFQGATYYETDDYTLFEVPFEGGQTMKFVLPKEGNALETLLDQESLEQILSEQEESSVRYADVKIQLRQRV